MLSRCLGEEVVGDEIQTEIRKFENRVASEKQRFFQVGCSFRSQLWISRYLYQSIHFLLSRSSHLSQKSRSLSLSLSLSLSPSSLLYLLQTAESFNSPLEVWHGFACGLALEGGVSALIHIDISDFRQELWPQEVCLHSIQILVTYNQNTRTEWQSATFL